MYMTSAAKRLVFRDVCQTVENAKALISLKEEGFAVQLKEQTLALGDAIVQENGWSADEAAVAFSNPAIILETVLGESSLAQFREFKVWLAENGTFSIYA